MDYRLKVRIETGPDIPSKLSRLGEPDARKAVLKAVLEQLLLDKWPADFIAKGTHGSTTACLFATKTKHFSEPSSSVPTSHVDEYEFIVELEGPAEAEFRGKSMLTEAIPLEIKDRGADLSQPTRRLMHESMSSPSVNTTLASPPISMQMEMPRFLGDERGVGEGLLVLDAPDRVRVFDYLWYVRFHCRSKDSSDTRWCSPRAHHLREGFSRIQRLHELDQRRPVAGQFPQ